LVQLDAQAKTMIEGLAVLRAQIDAKDVELQAMRSYSTEHNPEVALAERELSSLRAEAARLQQRNHSPGFGDMGLEDVPGAGLEYLRAEHELKYRQAMFDLLIKQYDAARLDESKDAAIIQVVEPAIVPDRRSSPQTCVDRIALDGWRVSRRVHFGAGGVLERKLPVGSAGCPATAKFQACIVWRKAGVVKTQKTPIPLGCRTWMH
jgi:hypothetical protein